MRFVALSNGISVGFDIANPKEIPMRYIRMNNSGISINPTSYIMNNGVISVNPTSSYTMKDLSIFYIQSESDVTTKQYLETLSTDDTWVGKSVYTINTDKDKYQVLHSGCTITLGSKSLVGYDSDSSEIRLTSSELVQNVGGKNVPVTSKMAV